ncbi:ABC transporter ATP-binding protein [Petroclostridium sp. X23]|uniref:ABC transporter ATP-binding protein n=1 Tax=Petroclostridium sp. X23 TaxID=3045146 RepID=UPI0024ACD945|nr:ABC transporter ATP-binding protein [Petroclostridium sp. X23]WHH58819.1 ABC transporter ATP-binding protein [Petroclostridium sp. X23]
MAMISVHDASFSYEKQPVFSHIGLQVGAAEVFCIAGPNGCGKTTLLDCMLGVKKLQSGKVSINGKNINCLKPRDIAGYVAYVPQAHEKTFPYTVMEIVLMGRAFQTGIFSSPSGEDRKIAEQAIETVGLAKYKHRPYTQLSGGEGQMVLIARALAQNSKVIIMDEPTAHLDFKHELTVLEMIVRLVKESGISVVMATHFLNHAFYFENNDIPTTIALMDNKDISIAGQPSAVLTQNNIQSIYNIQSTIISLKSKTGRMLNQIIPISAASK